MAATKRKTKSASSSTPARKRSSSSSSSKTFKTANIEAYLERLWSKPSTRYVLGGIAVSALIPLGSRLLKAYPGIGDFLRENLDAVEEKLGGLFEDDSSSVAHH